ncbi:MAG TPA: flavoprotein [Candidatus Saccharibacteria bacterium]|nr:flavoprotein [Candidatus Saccharibacteria bacterium]HRQ07067.1 flavoprotein [Candidatus Saccharibacteria bacterium]
MAKDDRIDINSNVEPSSVVIYLVVSAASKIKSVLDLSNQINLFGYQVILIPTPSARTALSDLDIPETDNLYVAQDKTLRLEGGNATTTKTLARPSAIVVAPATFNTVSKIANGIADNYALGLVASGISDGVPIIVAPSYSDMWNHPLNVSNLETLQSWNVRIVWPDLEEDHITMAPTLKITDTLKACVYKVKFQTEKLDNKYKNQYDSMIEPLLEDFQTIGRLAERDGINNGVNGCIGVAVDDKWLVITSTGSKLADLHKDNLTLVNIPKSTKFKRIFWYGHRTPSSETPLYLSLLHDSPELRAIIHTHYPQVTYNKSLSKYKTKNYIPYGEFISHEEVSRLIRKWGFGIMRLHGEVSAGKSLTEAYEKLHKHALLIDEGTNRE